MLRVGEPSHGMPSLTVSRRAARRTSAVRTATLPAHGWRCWPWRSLALPAGLPVCREAENSVRLR